MLKFGTLMLNVNSFRVCRIFIWARNPYVNTENSLIERTNQRQRYLQQCSLISIAWCSTNVMYIITSHHHCSWTCLETAFGINLLPPLFECVINYKPDTPSSVRCATRLDTNCIYKSKTQQCKTHHHITSNTSHTERTHIIASFSLK